MRRSMWRWTKLADYYVYTASTLLQALNWQWLWLDILPTVLLPDPIKLPVILICFTHSLIHVVQYLPIMSNVKETLLLEDRNWIGDCLQPSGGCHGSPMLTCSHQSHAPRWCRFPSAAKLQPSETNGKIDWMFWHIMRLRITMSPWELFKLSF